MEQSERKKILKRVEQFSSDNSFKDDIHGFKHTKRVCNLSLKIGKTVGADLFILRIAALMHDIGRTKEDENSVKNHAEISAEMALEFFKNGNIKLKENEIENIIHSIKAHSFSYNLRPETLEAMVLSDVDKLDALGAIGLYRTIGFTVKNKGSFNEVIEHLDNKILKLDQKLFLDESKELATKRLRIVEAFYKEAKQEINHEMK
ncbi:MAG: putative hydrolase [Promethearchaeota archaeon]|jgi:uncharacterized protein|nr:MAG: putative hydrolase [Candidatus Lokiarchaeota archaeon]